MNIRTLPLALFVTALCGGTAAGQIVFDSTLPGTTAGALTPVNSSFVIPQNRGFTNGSNLFQSFQQFNVGAGETAVFQSGDAIRHILARVTGNMPTTVGGTLSAANPAITALWLLNPAGLLVTESAVLDVPGAVALGAADRIRFTDRRAWAATPALGNAASTLTADPSAFLFVPGPPARGVTVLGNHFGNPGPDRIADGKAWLLAGSTVTIASAGDLALNAARVTTLAVAPGKGLLDVSAGGTLGLTATALETQPGAVGAGDIVLTARTIRMSERSSASSRSGSPLGTGSVIVTADNLTIDNSRISLLSTGPGSMGDIDVLVSGDMLLDNIGQIRTDAALGASGGGSIRIVAGKLRIVGPTYSGSRIQTYTEDDSANAGDLHVEADTIELVDGGALLSFSFGTGRAGDISVSASRGLTLAQGSIASEGDAGAYEEFTDVAGNGGGISVNLGRGAQLNMSRNGEISTASVQSSGGDIDITLDQGALQLQNSYIRTSVNGGTGSGGDIMIDAGGSSLDLNASAIFAAAWELGNGGSITIDRAGRTLLRLSEIGAQSEGGGNGGNIIINTVPGAVFVQDSLSLVSAEAKLGINGQISINSPNTDLNATMRPQEVDVARPATLASNACAAPRGESRSTLVQESKGGRSADAGTYLTDVPASPQRGAQQGKLRAPLVLLARNDAGPEPCL